MDLIKKKISRIDHEGGDRLKPRCFIDDEQFLLDLWEPWKDVVLVKLLGKQVGYFTMRDRLHATMRDLVDVGHGFYMVKFDFVASEVKIDHSMVWIRFPSLGMELYDEDVLLALATTVGKPVKVDIHTVDASRGKFARVCIDIDLAQPLVGRVWLRGRWFNVE